jgi:hypothetical protein
MFPSPMARIHALSTDRIIWPMLHVATIMTLGFNPMLDAAEQNFNQTLSSAGVAET